MQYVSREQIHCTLDKNKNLSEDEAQGFKYEESWVAFSFFKIRNLMQTKVHILRNILS